MAASPKARQPKPTTFEQRFLRLFRQIRRKQKFASAPAAELQVRLFESVVGAALSKCLDFNVLVNSPRRAEEDHFVIVGGLRGICEDLIVLRFLSNLPPDQAEKYVRLRRELNTAEGIAAQRSFFLSNNPLQPVFGLSMTEEDAEGAVATKRDELRTFWKSAGHAKRDGPTIRDMADAVGLSATYRYIYFAASNFAHFNPHALLRTGWGPIEGPFEFSLSNLSDYYRSLGSFYGAVVFLGFHATFAEKYFEADLSRQIETIEATMEALHRWPEIVTFEEMNTKPSLPHWMLHLIREAKKEKGEPVTYGAILREVRGRPD